MTRIHREHGRFVIVDGIKTHYLDVGSGLPVVLLHDGGFGADATLTWYKNLDAIASRYRIIAPDWLGYGQTDKLHDFGGGRARRLKHMTRFLETLCIDRAFFAGCSMGATVLLQVAASGEEPWPVAGVVAVSGGGFAPMNDARRKALSFDCTLESLRTVVSTYVQDQSLLDDPMMVRARYESAILPGAWEAISAVRFKSPLAPEVSDFGNQDKTSYESISVPTLLFAGGQDKLRDPGYAQPVASRIPDCELQLFERCGHLPNIEEPERFNKALMDFLSRRYSSQR